MRVAARILRIACRSEPGRLPAVFAAARPLLLVVEDDKMTQALARQRFGLGALRRPLCPRRDRCASPFQVLATTRHSDGHRLPGMDGVALTQYLKSTLHLANIPVVIMTETRGMRP